MASARGREGSGVPLWVAGLAIVVCVASIALLGATIAWAIGYDRGSGATMEGQAGRLPSAGGRGPGEASAPAGTGRATPPTSGEGAADSSGERATPSASPMPPLTIPAAFSTTLLTKRAAHWDAVVAALPQGRLAPISVRGPAGQQAPGLQRFADDVAAADSGAITQGCVSVSPDYVARTYANPRLAAAVLAALTTEPTSNPAGWVWEGATLTLFVSFAEAEATYSCPDVHLRDEFENVRASDLEWMVYRYLARAAGRPLAATEEGRELRCTNLAGNTGWGPANKAGSSKNVIPLIAQPDPFAGATPSLDGPPTLATGARDAGEGFTYYIAAGYIPISDGTTRPVTFVLGSLWMPPNPCLGQIELSVPEAVVP